MDQQYVVSIGIARPLPGSTTAEDDRDDSWDSTGITEPNLSKFERTYPLVNVYIAMENHHAINGKIHYFYGHFQ